MRIKANAKLNLTLNVTGRAEDGYHRLDGIYAAIDLYDVVKISRRKDRLVKIKMFGQDCEFLHDEDNNAYKAAKLFIERFNTNGADISVYKNIPVGSGLGGSSADAAAVLNGMSKLYKIDDDLTDIALRLGSDVPFMLGGGVARVSDRGDKVKKIASPVRLWALLLASKQGVSTAQCFKRFDELCQIQPNDNTDRCAAALENGDAQLIGASLHNDLYSAAIDLNDEIADALDYARSFSPLGCLMSGSGSAVYALFDTRELCEWAQSRYRGKRKAYVVTLQTRTVKPLLSPYALTDEEKRLTDGDLTGDI